MRNVTLTLCALLLAASASAAWAADAGKGGPVQPTAPKVQPTPAPSTDAGVKKPATEPAKTAAAVPAPPQTPAEAVGLVKQIITAVKTGKWAWAVGLILMVLVFLVNRVLSKKIPPAVLPWLAISLGVLSNVFLAIGMGTPWLDAALGGLTEGLAASGAWSALGKYLLPSNTATVPSAAATPAAQT